MHMFVLVRQTIEVNVVLLLKYLIKCCVGIYFIKCCVVCMQNEIFY